MYERDRILAAVDLGCLADELLGVRKGTQTSGSWPCPNADHGQTGKTPPVSVFRSRRGEQRWRCHGCGVGGTAIDLVMAKTGCDVRDAFDIVARRAGVQPASATPGGDMAPIPRDDGALDTYIYECADRLWRPDGARVRSWLMVERGIPERVLRANAVGADIGPRRQGRPRGVPRAGLAAVLPAIDGGRPVYAQLRRIRPRADQPKFLNIASGLATNPKLARYRPAQDRSGVVIVTEGPIDALSAAAAGYRAVAVLGAMTPDPDVAARLAALPGHLVLAFDADEAGRNGAARIASMLSDLSRAANSVALPDGINDLNDWLLSAEQEWPSALSHAIDRVVMARRQVSRPSL